MKKLIIRWITILLAFLAGAWFMSYATYRGNLDMTEVMAEATLPVVYAERDGKLYNEMHGYVQEMDGSFMKEAVLGLSNDHSLGIAVEKFNARIKDVSYEVRSLDMSRLIESGEGLLGEDDGKYLHLQLSFKDLMERREKYLFILTVHTEEHGDVDFYSQITYLGENHVEECVDFIQRFHEACLQKDDDYLGRYLEPNQQLMDGKNLGYVNINSRTGPVSWGDMKVEQVSDTQYRLTGLDGDVVSLVMEYHLQNMETEETYLVKESFQIRYTSDRIYLNAFERTTDQIFEAGSQLVTDESIAFGIQGKKPEYAENKEENVIAFVRQGQLWSYDFGQNRLSRVYGFQDGEDTRGLYDAHEFRILDVEDSGSMDFLVIGYMNRGRYEGMNGVLLCRYDALLNTVEEQFFLPSDRPFEVVKEEVGKLSVSNGEGKAWLSYQGMILQVNLADSSVRVLAEGIKEDWIQVSENGKLAAWTDEEHSYIRLLDTRSGRVNEIKPQSGEVLQALGFMEEDFIYGTARQEDVCTDMAGRQTIPMYRVIIRDHAGNEVREFDYSAKGKYVTDVTIVENRIDLSCVARQEDGSYTAALPEPITYTSEPADEKLELQVVSHEVKRNEYFFTYGGKMKEGSMKRPKVKLVLFEGSRTLQIEDTGTEQWFAWSYDGKASGFDTLAEAVIYANQKMGKVWKDGANCCWERTGRVMRTQVTGFENPEELMLEGDSITVCLQLLLRQKQIYKDVQGSRDAGLQVWEIMNQELGDSACLLPGCSLDMVKYYISNGVPVMGMTDTGTAILIVGYDPQNILYYEPGQTVLKKSGTKDSTAMFEAAGNLFFTYLP